MAQRDTTGARLALPRISSRTARVLGTIDHHDATLSLLRRGPSLKKIGKLVDRIGEVDTSVPVGVHEGQIGRCGVAGQGGWAALENMAQQTDHVGEIESSIVVAVAGAGHQPRKAAAVTGTRCRRDKVVELGATVGEAAVGHVGILRTVGASRSSVRNSPPRSRASVPAL